MTQGNMMDSEQAGRIQYATVQVFCSFVLGLLLLGGQVRLPLLEYYGIPTALPAVLWMIWGLYLWRSTPLDSVNWRRWSRQAFAAGLLFLYFLPIMRWWLEEELLDHPLFIINALACAMTMAWLLLALHFLCAEVAAQRLDKAHQSELRLAGYIVLLMVSAIIVATVAVCIHSFFSEHSLPFGRLRFQITTYGILSMPVLMTMIALHNSWRKMRVWIAEH